MSQLGTKNPTYKDGRTKQTFRDETDINAILKRAQKTGTVSHLNKYEARYGDFANFDFFEAQLQLTAGREIFDALPSEIRNEFNQSQAEFFEYVNDPANKDRLGELLPALAEPGRQNIVVKTANADDEKAALEAAKPAPKEPEATVEETAKKAPEAPPKAPEEPSTPVT